MWHAVHSTRTPLYMLSWKTGENSPCSVWHFRQSSSFFCICIPSQQGHDPFLIECARIRCAYSCCCFPTDAFLQTFGFLNLPAGISLSPNDGYGYILPGESVTRQVGLEPPISGPQKFSIMCKTLAGKASSFWHSGHADCMPHSTCLLRRAPAACIVCNLAHCLPQEVCQFKVLVANCLKVVCFH